MIRHFLSLVLSLSFVLPSVAWGAKKVNRTEEKAKVLQEMMNEFRKLCIGPDGKVLLGSVAIDRSQIAKDGKVLNCQDEAKRLGIMIESLQTELYAKTKIKNPVICTPDDPQIQAVLADIGASTKLVQKVAGKEDGRECKVQDQSALQCTKDVFCNLTRIVHSTPELKSFKGKSDKSCTNYSRSNCFAEAIAGVVKDVIFNVQGMWELVKLAGKGAKKAATATWGMFTKTENASSEAALFASAQTPSMIDLFKKEPMEFLKQLVGQMWASAGTAIKQNFGCEKWSGAPHVSQCEKEMASWNCSTCNQKFNAICGVVGAVGGGELLFSFLTGGTLSMAGKLGGKGAEVMSKAHEAVVKAIPTIEKTEKMVTSGAKTVGLKGHEATRAVLESELAQLILNAARTGAVETAGIMSKVVNSTPMNITIKVLSGAATPVTRYIQLMDRSFSLGMNKGNVFFDKANRGMHKLSEVVKGKVPNRKIDELIVNSSQFEDVSQEVIQARLKAKGIDYESVTLNDGSQATRVKSRPECGSRPSMIIK